MNWIASTLWELLNPRSQATPPRRRARIAPRAAALNGHAPAAPRRPTAKRPASTPRSRPAPVSTGMQARYDALVKEMLAAHGIRVRKWRTSSSGRAWIIRYRDGAVSRLLESPYPRGPMSCAIFLHEIAHHVIGFGAYRPRCLEEFHAWDWAIRTMEQRGFNVTDSVRTRMARSLRYAVDKARRRGLSRVPVELQPFIDQQPHSLP